MGIGCGCCSSNTQKVIIDTTAWEKNPNWADAVTKNKLGGIRMLHAENPDLINELVDSDGHCAIHLAIQHKNGELLMYLLNNGVNINAKGGKERNTALHEASKMNDMKAVRNLFSYGIDDSILNKDGKRAIDFCPKSIKREFTKAKQYRNKHREQLNNMQHHRGESTDITIAGMSLKSTNTQQIKKFFHQQDLELNFYKNKKKEIEERDGMAITSFGENVGCEMDEIAMTLQKVPDAGKLWDKWAKKGFLTRQTEIYKIMYGLTVLTLKKKNPRAKKPPANLYISISSKKSNMIPTTDELTRHVVTVLKNS
eukprot:159467_1